VSAPDRSDRLATTAGSDRPPVPIPRPEAVQENLTRVLREVALLKALLRVSKRAYPGGGHAA
jgi:hypothetical protein